MPNATTTVVMPVPGTLVRLTASDGTPADNARAIENVQVQMEMLKLCLRLLRELQWNQKVSAAIPHDFKVSIQKLLNIAAYRYGASF